MRILLVSDLHYKLQQLDWVVSVAADYDLVVAAGDLLDIASIVEPDAQIAVMLEYFSRIAAKTPLVVCSGNHDLNARNDSGERAALWIAAARERGIYVDGTRLETDDALVTVCPWWDGPDARAAIGRQLAEDATQVAGRRWIWAYHGPPEGSATSWTGKRHYGDDALDAWIAEYQPQLVLCGHVHQSPFAKGGAWIDRIGATLVCNAGRQTGPVPTCIELDTGTEVARWLSLAGRDEKEFAAV
jgi:Icc-related predicted phosphoesterase